MNDEQRIRERAHRIWEEEGRPEGRHAEHWNRACRELGQGPVQCGGSGAAPEERAGSTASPKQAPGKDATTTQSAPITNTGLVGSDDNGTGVPDAMGVDDLNVGGRSSDPRDTRPTTGRSKLVGS